MKVKIRSPSLSKDGLADTWNVKKRAGRRLVNGFGLLKLAYPLM